VKLLLELVRGSFSIILDADILTQQRLQEGNIMAVRNEVPVVHIRFEGRSMDIPLAELDLGPLSADADIKRAVARHLEISDLKLRDYVVDRHETGNLTVRPEAVFG
jgi:hypothetical protein